MRYAIVDIETTGSYQRSHAITEIAIIIHDGEKILDTFETLINPETSIVPFVSRMTGIPSNSSHSAMVRTGEAGGITEVVLNADDASNERQ